MAMKYNTRYYENMLEMYAGSGHNINEIRWKLIAEANPKVVLDYGCGCGMFSLFRPDGVVVDSYDIGMISNAPYPQTGIRHDHYDVICFWDVLEHVDWFKSPDEDILDWLGRTHFVAASIPILPVGADMRSWKHHKPGEHLTYFTEMTFIKFMENHGFELVTKGTPECPPRLDIHSFLFRRSK